MEKQVLTKYIIMMSGINRLFQILPDQAEVLLLSAAELSTEQRLVPDHGQPSSSQVGMHPSLSAPYMRHQHQPEVSQQFTDKLLPSF